MKTKAIIKCTAAIALAAFCIFLISAKPKQERTRVLIFSKTNGYRHSSIPVGIAAIKKLGLENDFDVDATEDSTMFNIDNLRKYSAVIFLSTTGKVFGPNEEKALKQYMNSGGGFVG